MKFKTPQGKNIEITETQINTIQKHTERYREKITVKHTKENHIKPSTDSENSLQRILEQSASAGFAGIYGNGLAVISSVLKNTDGLSVAEFGHSLSQKAHLEMEQERQMKRIITDIMEHIHNNPPPHPHP